MGDLSDDDRKHGMGIVVEYAGYKGKAQWITPKPFKWNYGHFGNAGAATAQPDEVLDMLFEKQNAAMEGFNQWTINGTAYPMHQMTAKPMFHLREGKRYRIRMKNASDDIHPIHFHRRSFELTRIAGQPSSGVMKDVVMVGVIKRWRLTSSQITLAQPCSTAINNSIWTSALWRYLTTSHEEDT
jgi:hypothetical protein